MLHGSLYRSAWRLVLFSGSGESAAPDGYNQLPAPVKVTVTATSHSTDAAEGGYVTIANSSEFTLPETGEGGTAVFTVIGLLIICTAAMPFTQGSLGRSRAIALIGSINGIFLPIEILETT